jgi:hypothetical protein
VYDRVSQKEYNFFPRTWVLPNDATDFKAQFDADGEARQTFIIKPDNGSKVTLNDKRRPTDKPHGKGAQALVVLRGSCTRWG